MEPVTPSFTATVHEEASKMNWDIKKVLLVAGSILLAIVLWTYIANPMVVTVTGSGQVSAPATNATVSFTLSATDNSIANAVSAVQSKAAAMKTFLGTQGVAEGDIAQSQVTAVPAALVTSGATGFQATISMAAKTVNVANIAGLIAALYTNGALVVAQPVLSVENQDTLDQEAFNAAMTDAKTQAWKIGVSNWKFIDKIVSISQVTSPSTSTSTTKADTLTANASTVAATNGVFKIVKAVSVSYKMW